jgi:hypothetical protein
MRAETDVLPTSNAHRCSLAQGQYWTGRVAHDLIRRRPEQGHVDQSTAVDAEDDEVSPFLFGYPQNLDVGPAMADTGVATLP